MTTENAPSNNQSSSAQQPPLTKSQKKRMKQKAAKAKREAEAAAAAAATPPPLAPNQNAEALNPHVKLRHDLLSRGFKSNEIETALEEMWDLGMEYDNLEAVSGYLESKKVQKKADEEAKAAAAVAAAVIESVVVASAVVPVEEDQEEYDDGDVAVVEHVNGGVSISQDPVVTGDGGTDDDDHKAVVEEVEAESEPEPASSPAAPMDLASKLDMVAHFENLQDAVFALSEWVTKAAKLNELLDLCPMATNNKVAPLHTIFRRCILECPKDSDYSTLRSTLKGLIKGIMVDSKPAVVESLLKSISLARGVITECKKAFPSATVYNNTAGSIAEFVTCTISSSLATTINAKNNPIDTEDPVLSSSGGDFGIVTVQKIEDEITVLLNQLPPRGTDGVMELMTRRDGHKSAAEKSSLLSQILIDAASSHTTNHSSTSTSATPTVTVRLSNEQAKKEMAVELLSEYAATVSESRGKVEEVTERLRGVQTERSVKRAAVSADLLNCQTEQARIAARREELQSELERLEAESEAIKEREGRLEEELKGLEREGEAPSQEEVVLSQERERLGVVVRVDDAVKKVLEELQRFESGIVAEQMEIIDSRAAVVQLKSDEKKKEITTIVNYGNKLSAFLDHMRNYFMAEADIITFLRGRVASLQIDMKNLQREVTECTALGMSTNVSQMTQSLQEITRNIADDGNAIEALRNEAQLMTETLTHRIRDYHALADTEPSSVTDGVTLREIVGLLNRIGVEGSAVAALAPATPIAVPATSNGRAGAAPISPPKGFEAVAPAPGFVGDAAQAPVAPVMTAPVTPPPAAPPVIMPKLSWAVPSNVTAKKVEVKSLLDIQKEEMSAKQAGR